METEQFRHWQAEEYFKHIMQLELKSRISLAEIRQAREKLDIAGVRYDKIGQGSSTDSAIPDGIAYLYEVIEKVQSDMVGYSSEIEEAKEAIAKLDDSRYQGVLTSRYILAFPWRKVSRTLNYSEPHTLRLNYEALVAAYDYIPYEWKTTLPKAQVD